MIVFGDVAVVVSDAKAAAEWWTKKLGFELRDDEGHWVTVAPKGATTVIHLCANGTHEEGNTGLGFEVPDVEATQAEWMAKGVKFTRPAAKTPWGGVVAHFADLDGNEFWLTQNEELAKPAKRAAPRKASSRKTGAKKAGKKAGKGAKKSAKRRR